MRTRRVSEYEPLHFAAGPLNVTMTTQATGVGEGVSLRGGRGDSVFAGIEGWTDGVSVASLRGGRGDSVRAGIEGWTDGVSVASLRGGRGDPVFAGIEGWIDGVSVAGDPVFAGIEGSREASGERVGASVRIGTSIGTSRTGSVEDALSCSNPTIFRPGP